MTVLILVGGIDLFTIKLNANINVKRLTKPGKGYKDSDATFFLCYHEYLQWRKVSKGSHLQRNGPDLQGLGDYYLGRSFHR